MTKNRLQFSIVKTQSKTFGEWLRKNRKLKQLTMEALATKVGVSKQYISVLELAQPHALTGKPVTPTIDVVESLARALNRPSEEARTLAGYLGSVVEDYFKPDNLTLRKIRGIAALLPEKELLEFQRILEMVYREACYRYIQSGENGNVDLITAYRVLMEFEKGFQDGYKQGTDQEKIQIEEKAITNGKLLAAAPDAESNTDADNARIIGKPIAPPLEAVQTKKRRKTG